MIELENRVDRLEDAMMRTHLMLQGLSQEGDRTYLMVQGLIQENYKTQTIVNKLSQDVDKTQGMVNKLSRELNQKFEKLTKMMGTLVEDMVIPNVDFIAEKYFNLKYGRILPRAKGVDEKDPKYSKEFDTLAVYPDKVIWVSAKLTAKPEYAEEFFKEVEKKELFEYFPEYQDKDIIPIFASFHIPDNVMTYLTRHKIYAMASKEDTMDIMNFEELK